MRVGPVGAGCGGGRSAIRGLSGSTGVRHDAGGVEAIPDLGELTGGWIACGAGEAAGVFTPAVGPDTGVGAGVGAAASGVGAEVMTGGGGSI